MESNREQPSSVPSPQPAVLVVDDTPTNLLVLKAALSRDYRVQTAADGASALSLLEAGERYDLILLDIVMPDMDGYEVCRRIKRNPALRDIPIIFITALDQTEDQQRGFALGAVDYITKPFEVPLLLARVNVHVRLKRKSEMLERLAFLDGLTDIPNRRAVEEALDREWQRAKRNRRPLSVLMIDVDEFKAFNDHCGHGAGDECLRRVARELQAGLSRPGDFVGRYGGEEFTAILPDCDTDGAAFVAERLRQRVAALGIHHPGGTTGYVTVSIGCTTRSAGTGATLSVCHLMEEADQALYEAKAAGRNRVSACPACAANVKYLRP